MFCKISRQVFSVLCFAFIIYMMLATLLQPQSAIDGTVRGIKLCYEKLLPSIFPFMVFAGIAMASPLAKYIGFIFIPYARLLGIKSPKAPSAILMGLLGGFAAGAQSINSLYENGDISKKQAELLLCCTIMSGPAFVIGAVGFGVFGSTAIGYFFFLSQCISSFLCAILFKFFMKESICLHNINSEKKANTLSQCLQNSVFSMISLCGTVIFFSCAQNLILPQKADNFTKFLLYAMCEVTSACTMAIKCASPAFLACAALSIMGGSVYMQVRGLCHEDISITPLLLSRILHLPIMLATYWCFCQIFPLQAFVSAQSTQFEIYFKMPADACLVLIVLVICVCNEVGTKKHLHRAKKHI